MPDYLGKRRACPYTHFLKRKGKGLAEKKDRTPDEDVMLELLTHGGSCVREENLADVLEWYGKEAGISTKDPR